ncbi:rhomboid-related protein 2 [Tribolium castaneum]|uniref:Protein rhomboid-like Protein n=1 Tax=Tribolium castaneum TaxID=7070 RepID=D6WUJ2_TRICA|nr:PREDICTED: rhomboid-related protein 2 [Tribolium castaneum]EFA08482.1 Protein rhomboid-like Protein [Tribolium castaneum]|eukprot:XP_972541.1 PREDICTED: rhomboid-related protein 2 [Tribolium castaneum]
MANSETPLQASRKNAYYRSIFDKYDRDHDGFINIGELNDLIESREYDHDIPEHVVRKIHQMADQNHDDRIDFTEFVDMINHPDLQYVFGHYVNRYIQMVVPRRRGASEVDGAYDDQYSCYPPAVGMIIISLIEVIFFCVDEAIEADSTKSASGPISSVFIYDPYKRQEAWRFITYMFVHVGAFHLFVNLLVQILLGTPLEMVHRWWRVLLIYFAGVLAGSLATSIADPTVRLAGASGGVYSLITAHIATIIMNWREMSFPIVQLFIFLIIMASDIGTAIYNRYFLEMDEHIGYMAHFAGAIAGLLVGLNVLRNLEVTTVERVIWWLSIVTYCLLMAIAIIWNFAWPEYFLKSRERI